MQNITTPTVHSTGALTTRYSQMLDVFSLYVTPWCVILFSTNSRPLVHPPVHFPPQPHQNRPPPPPQGLSREMRCEDVIVSRAGIWKGYVSVFVSSSLKTNLVFSDAPTVKGESAVTKHSSRLSLVNAFSCTSSDEVVLGMLTLRLPVHFISAVNVL
jgi:hypothetical protein